MKKLFLLALVSCLTFLNPASIGADGANGLVIWSDAVQGTTTRTGSNFGTRCGSGSANAVEEAATAALLDDWALASAAEGYSYISPAVTPADGTSADSAVLTFSGVNSVDVTVTRRQVTAASAHDPADTSTGALNNNSVFTDRVRLQDCAPRPASFLAGPGPVAGTTIAADVLFSGMNTNPTPATYWNATTFPSGNQLDAALFEFSQPVGSFGLWFGDLETRDPDLAGGAVLARVKLFDAAGDVVQYAEILPDESPATDAVCGGSVLTTDAIGCGNQSSRFIGFVDPDSSITSMMVVVGDDDSCAQAGQCDGITEYLSWIGPMLGVGQPDLSTTKTVTKAPTFPGDTVSWELVVSNNGTAAAIPGWIVTDVAGTNISGSILTGDAAEVDCAAVTSCTGLVPIEVGESITIQVDAISNADVGETISNAAYVSPSPDDVVEIVPEGTPPNAGDDTGATDTNNDSNVDLQVTAPPPTTTTTVAPTTTTTVAPVATTEPTIVTTTTSTTTTGAAGNNQAELPRTGGEAGDTVAIALGLILGGAVTLLVSSPRRRQS